MTIPTVIDLPYPPSENHRYGRRRDGRVYLLPKVKEWRSDAGFLLRTQKPEKINGPYRFKLLVKKPDKRVRDVSNLIKETLDLVVREGVAPDDRYAEIDGAYWSDAIPDGCRVILTPME